MHVYLVYKYEAANACVDFVYLYLTNYVHSCIHCCSCNTASDDFNDGRVVVNMGYATKAVIQLAFLSIPISSIRIQIIYSS